MSEARMIPESFIQGYVDQLLEVAGKLTPHSPMHAALLLRVDHTLDLVKAWREHKARKAGADAPTEGR